MKSQATPGRRSGAAKPASSSAPRTAEAPASTSAPPTQGARGAAPKPSARGAAPKPSAHSAAPEPSPHSAAPEKTATGAKGASTATDPPSTAGEKRIAVTLDRTQLEIIEGDITTLAVDAIVNPANERLQLGAGVAGAIRERGGPSVQEECNRIGGTPVGTAVMTGAGNLPARQVIHAVGPRMGEGDEDRKLSSAVRAALALADRRGLRTIALPAISTGSFGFPMDRAARVMLTEIHRYLQGGTKLERVVVCLWGDDAFGSFRRELRRGFR